MSQKKFTPGKKPSSPPDQAGGKKPHATLDLKATEVKSASAGDSSKAAPETSGSTPGTYTSVPKPGVKAAEMKAAEAASASDKPAEAAKPGDTKTADTAAKGAAASSPAGSSTSARPAATATAARQRSGSGIGSFFSHLVAGLVGGFLMLLGADALQPQIAQLKTGLGLSQTASKSDTGIAKLSERLAALESAQGAPGSTDTEALGQKLADAEARLAALEPMQESVAALKAAQEDLSQKAAALGESAGQAGNVPEERLSKLEQQLATMTAFAESNKNSGVVPRLASLTGRMADLEETLKNQIAAVRAGVGEDIEARLSKVAESSEAARSGTQRMDRQLSGVANDTARLSQQLETVKADAARIGDTLRVVQEETAKISSQLTGLEGDVTAKFAKLASPDDVNKAVNPVAQQVATLQGQVENVVSAEKNRAQNAKRIVLALELGGLTRAIERGEGFADELAQVKQTAGGILDVAKLEPFESLGVASVAKLQSMFSPVADAIIEASSAPAGDSVLDQLLANARSVVKIRKVSHDADDKSSQATVARMESALAAGRLDDVLKLAEELPAAGKQAAEGWLNKVRDRHSVDQALAALEEQLKSSLAGTN
ncbi:MAG: hypothetical protein KJ622_04480 [Alphaproteobacteria bacterium]|nr:hypothetical protein [Alphaproteobacteria bacterium]